MGTDRYLNVCPHFRSLFFASAPSPSSRSVPIRDLAYPSTKITPKMESVPILVGEHLWMVIVSSGLATVIGISIGVLVTRPLGRQYLPLVSNLSSLGQTFPPVAVLALAVPLLGFGFKPTVAALLLYGLLPILRNTITGIENIPSEVREAAYGMGMSSWQVLFKIELPLALKVIMSGVRISVVINIGTATVGATIGAGGLGSPITAGLVSENPAFILEGAIPAALLAFSADSLLGNIEKSFSSE